MGNSNVFLDEAVNFLEELFVYLWIFHHFPELLLLLAHYSVFFFFFSSQFQQVLENPFLNLL